MPRARNLKPSFFKDEELVECGQAAMLLFAGLWCLADREGRLEDRPKLIKAEIFPYSDVSVEAYLKVLDEKNFISRYEVEGKRYIEVRNFKKHQHPHVKELPSTIPAPGQHQSGTMPAPGQSGASTGNSGTDPGNSGASTSCIFNPLTLTLNPESGASPVSAEPELDHEAEFLARWNRWPSKGQTRQPLSQQRWCDVFLPLSPSEARAVLAEIDAGLDRWLNSKQFAKGFVFAFADFVAQRRWNEQPEQTEAPADEQYSNQEVEDHWQEMQRLMKQGVKTHEADQQARQMIAERRRHAAAS